MTLALLIAVPGCKKDNKEVLASLTTIAPSGVTANTIQTGGTITASGGSSITQRGICWATHPAPTVGDSITRDGIGTGSFTTTLNNLASFTQYYIRAYAINAVGTAYGDEQNFTTLIGLATLTTTAVSGIVPFTALSGGNIISDGGSQVTARGIVWATTVHPTINNSFKTSDSVGEGLFTSTLVSLASQTVYFVRAYATNAFGTSYGNEVRFTSSSAEAVVDIDGNAYGYLTIGNQVWMSSNLKVSHYQNGDPITDGSANHSAFYNNWYNQTTGAFTYPNDSVGANNSFGKYYDELVIGDPRGICPVGWHIPTDNEWKTLEIYEGMSQADADMPHTPAQSGEINSRGTIGAKLLIGGSSGLNLQLAGQMGLDEQVARYYLFNQEGYYWSSTSPGNTGPLPTTIAYWYRGFNRSGMPDPIERIYATGWSLSVRCIKD